ncbi:alpha/beta-hydrolase [Lindgomyces ingoldianus]|uniref:Alpha/beta-hydrolase n=1 Tax=Lindgomyces ingoldianus TaxID=673940 RepID=A0ACB6QWT3_9PLEO|nr:alpha/beta-hydrolase [Lindgomyces ingoldianus]KAF2471272.1 alpha/beta-hydrolase [Lindgomyces ingoldianus]
MSKPVIVVIPGAWHTPAVFEPVKRKLESDHSYTVLSSKLPSVGSNPPPEDLSKDVETLRKLVTEAIGNGNDVVVVPHSWSGIVAGSALTGMGKKQREENGEKGGVTRIAFMCSFIAPKGVSLLDAIQHVIPDWWEVKEPHTFAKDAEIFYNDLPVSEQQHWMSLLESHAFATKKAKATANAWMEIPNSYLMCENDNAIPIFAQELMVNQAKRMGAEFEVERIKSSHSPFLSQPDRVVEFIRRAAGEKI